MFIIEVEDKFVEFQDSIINIKATIAIFRSTKADLDDYDKLLEEINGADNHLTSRLERIMNHANDTLKAENYQTYILIEREMKQTDKIINEINDIWKHLIYRIFYNSLGQTLKNLWNTKDEEFKYDLTSSPDHPIFDKELNLFTVVWQETK